jgi:FkbM family methyltransferase
MLKQLLLFVSGRASVRKLAQQSFALPGVGPMLRHSAERILPRGERIWVTIAKGPGAGLSLKIEPYWEPGYLRGSPELGVTEALIEHLSEGDCFYDIGAHIGYYSLIAARRVGPGGHVVAVEPDPDNVQVMRENVLQNRFENVDFVTAAVWNTVGSMSFEKGADTPSRMAGKIITDGSSPQGNVICCQAVTVDHLSASHRPPDAVKVDVEGGEIQVLEGARETLSCRRPFFLIEIHSMHNETAVREFLKPFGYTIWAMPTEGSNLHLCCEHRS